jgi:hypothetical protein
MAKLEYAERYTLGELIDHLSELAEDHGKDVPIGRIGHFGEIHFADKYMVSLSSSLRDKYEVPINDGWRSNARKPVPLLLEFEMPDIGEEPN